MTKDKKDIALKDSDFGVLKVAKPLLEMHMYINYNSYNIRTNFQGKILGVFLQVVGYEKAIGTLL